MPKTPILLLIPRNSNNQIPAPKPTLLPQFLRKSSIKSLLRSVVPTLLENLNKDKLIRAFEAKIGVFANELVGVVLGYDLREALATTEPTEGLLGVVAKARRRGRCT